MSGPTESIYVETQALYNCASAWRDDAVPSLETARTKAANGEGQGYLFGVLLASLQDPHSEFASSSATVLTSGKEVAGEFGSALEKVAKDYENTDDNVATLHKKP